MKSKFEKCYSILSSGRELKLSCGTIVMLENNEIAWELTSDGKELYSLCDLSFNCLTKEFDKVDDTYLTLKLAEIALDKSK